MKLGNYIALLSILIFMGCQNTSPVSLPYLDQTPPKLTPIIFAPGVISLADRSEFGSVFSSDGREFYYGVDVEQRSEIHHTIFKDKRWTEVRAILSDTVISFNDPFLSPTNDELFFITNRTVDGGGRKKDYDIYYIKRNGKEWSTPIRLNNHVNTDKNEYYMSFTASGDLYFSSNIAADSARQHDFDIFKSKLVNNEFQVAQKLPDAINSRAYEADVFIAPDESYMIFCSARRSGFGKGDLYISFKSQDGNWTNGKNMGSTINSKEHELCPFVTADGRYFFYTSNQDIYWVDALILEQFR